MDILLPKISDNDVMELQAAFENDLIAYYKTLEDDILEIIDKGDVNNPGKIMAEIDELFGQK
jgi:hypothetical protein